MVNTTYNPTEDMISKLHSLKGKTNLKMYKNISNYYGNINIRMNEDTFDKTAQGIIKIYHEALFLMYFLHTKPQVRNMNINYYDSYYTVIKNRDDKEIVNDKYGDSENGYISLNDVIIPNHYIGKRGGEK